MRAKRLPLFAFAAIAPWSAASAQPSAPLTLERFPFELPLEIISEERSEDGVAILAARDRDACAQPFADALAQRTPVAPDWTVVGQGFDPNAGAWNFGLLRSDGVLFHATVTAADDGCRVAIATEGSLNLAGQTPWSYPPLPLSDGSTLDVDPMVIIDR
jgi:hypothetical protein